MLRRLALAAAIHLVASLPARAAAESGSGQASAKDGVNPKAVEFVLSKVECSNPEDVVTAVFGCATYDDPRSPYHYSNIDVKTRDLGDGTPCHVFEPFEGGVSTRYFFALEDGKMRLLLKAKAAFLLERKPKVNGRHLIAFGDYGVARAGGGHLLTNRECISFWNGREYVVAYTISETTLISAAPGERTETEIGWNEGARREFLKAPRTWTYLVDSEDTLTKIARRLETGLAEVVAQNGITDPDRIFVGQELRFDSRKAKTPQPMLPGGVCFPELPSDREVVAGAEASASAK